MKTTAGLFYLVLGLAGPAAAYPRPDSLNRRAPAPDHRRAGAVRRAFQTAWEGYYEHAFPHDTLLPLTNGFEDDRCVPLRH
jgi:mannosyl-oligosaccharide alpha-1,2-mannosidase